MAITQRDLRRMYQERQRQPYESGDGRMTRPGTTGMVCAVEDGEVVDEFGVKSKVRAGLTWWAASLLLEIRDKAVLRLFNVVDDEHGAALAAPAAASTRASRPASMTVRPKWWL